MRVVNLDSPHPKLVSKVSGKEMWISDFNCTRSVLFVRLELHYMNVKPFWIKWTFIAWLDMLQEFLFPPTLTYAWGINSISPTSISCILAAFSTFDAFDPYSSIGYRFNLPNLHMVYLHEICDHSCIRSILYHSIHFWLFLD